MSDKTRRKHSDQDNEVIQQEFTTSLYVVIKVLWKSTLNWVSMLVAYVGFLEISVTWENNQ